MQDYTYTEFTNIRQTSGGATFYRVETTNTTLKQTFNGSSITAIAQASNLSHAPYSETLPSPELTLDLLPLINDTLLPGGVVFTWNGQTYYDRDGQVFTDLSTETNAGLQVGSIDYSGGVVTLATYPQGGFISATIEAAATIGPGFKVDAVAFRTTGSPVRLGSLQLTAVRVDNGAIITASADFNGEINTSEVQGKIDTTTGWCEIQFTNGTDPIFVIPQSIRYNCIVETSLPISHTSSTNAAPPTAGQLNIQPRYPASSWSWSTATMDRIIPASMVIRLRASWRLEPQYNAVYVSGTHVGVAVNVKRSGTAGDELAPDILEDWLTETQVNTE